MKYAFMTFSTPELSIDQTLDAAVKYGYDGIEIRIDAKHKHGLETDSDKTVRQNARKNAADKGIDICCIATSCRFALVDEEAENADNARKAIELAADLDAPCIRVFGGQIPKDKTREESIDNVVRTLCNVAEFASDHNVTICFETHDAWCDPNHVAAVIQGCDHPNIRVNCDIMHPVRMGLATMDETFDILGKWITHVHFHDGHFPEKNLHMCPVGEGEIDHITAVKRLLELNYQGFLSGEWINWEPWEQHLPRELAVMKQYESDIK